MNGEFNSVVPELLCSHLILCIHNIHALSICIKQFDVVQLMFDKNAAFKLFISNLLLLHIVFLSLTVTLRGYLINNAYCLFSS